MTRAEFNIGVTGSRRGATLDQLNAAAEELSFQARGHERVWLLHGDCLGVDKQIQKMALDMGFLLWVFPPSKKEWRAWCHGDRVEKPRGYHKRNQHIVDECDLLLAFPSRGQESGGTWDTIRRAEKAGKPVLIIYFDGAKEWRNREACR